MSIAYELWHEENVVRLYDDYRCPVMSDHDPKAFIEMQPIDLTAKPTNVQEEVELLDRIFKQALEQSTEMADVMINNLGVSRCGFIIRGDEEACLKLKLYEYQCWHQFSYEAFQKWRELNHLPMSNNPAIDTEAVREEIKLRSRKWTLQYPQPVTMPPNFGRIKSIQQQNDEMQASWEEHGRIILRPEPVQISQNYQTIGHKLLTVDEIRCGALEMHEKDIAILAHTTIIPRNPEQENTMNQSPSTETTEARTPLHWFIRILRAVISVAVLAMLFNGITHADNMAWKTVLVIFTIVYILVLLISSYPAMKNGVIRARQWINKRAK